MRKLASTKVPVAPEGDDTPARLKQAALRCVGRWGLAKTGLGDIAKEAGCARQTVYNHFPDARAVIAAALFDASTAFVTRLYAAIRAHQHAGDRILEAMCFCLRHLPNEPMLQFVIGEEGVPFINVVAFKTEPAWQLLRSVAAECVAPAPELASHVDELAEMMTRTLLSMLLIEPPKPRTAAQTRAMLGRWLLAPLGLSAGPSIAAMPRSRESARRTPSSSRRG
jgi:AcrR family transcriptional regulator